ncbi:hypothetical protein QFC21_005234 [Naganishia friedmannii]|uniref:Uncharacterized protein n=1 Tax=Naganishia friedmannii TaxID=89922 RepID=A0ACC2VAU3_9TREE|nr:hypothetical protein QFC21_005234 [Naganishia friedmannii]
MSSRYELVSNDANVSPDDVSLRSRHSLSGLLSRRQNSQGPSFIDTQELEAAFDDGSDSDSDDGTGAHDQRRLLSGTDGRDVRHVRDEDHFQIGDDDRDAEDDEEKKVAKEVQGVFSDPLQTSDGNHEIQSAPDQQSGRMPGYYDFDRDYFLPPPIPSESPPPFQPNSRWRPAQGNNNGIMPDLTHIPEFPNNSSQSRSLIGSLLPSFYGRKRGTGSDGTTPSGPAVGGGNTGVFANLAARPEAGRRAPAPGEEEGPEWVPEESQKEAPPSYATALRDAVPPYWETTVVLPSQSSPFGTLTSSMTGDEVLIDGMPVGNLFAFGWNMIVSMSFQFVGFLLTYVLHTSHAAKFGSRAGLGITLIQYGLYLRGRAEEMIRTGKFPPDGMEPDNADFDDPTGLLGTTWMGQIPKHTTASGEIAPEFPNFDASEDWRISHNMTKEEMWNLPSAEQVGEANEWLSFILMTVGWFLLITSVGGFWRVKRFENGLRASQNTEADDPTSALANNADNSTSPRQLSFYTQAFGQALNGVERIGRNVRNDLLARARRRGPLATGSTSETDAHRGDHVLLFARPSGDIDQDDGVDYPGLAERQGLTPEEWSRQNLYHG